MIYAMSDIHGCYDKYVAMLDKIQLKDDDTLLILGDVIDRGQDGIKVLRNMMKRPNIRPFLGNHEMMMYLTVKELLKSEEERNLDRVDELMSDWLIFNGGSATFSAYFELEKKERKKILRYLDQFDVYDELTVGKRTFFVSHAGLDHFGPQKKIEDYSLSDFVEGRMDYSRVYFPDKIMLSGHTPTFSIGEEYRGKIYQKNNHIVLDCGTVFGNPLGCICLDTMEEFYV